MNKTTSVLYAKAIETKYKLARGLITLEQAKAELKEYGENFNEVSKRIAKEYGGRAKLFSAASFLR